MSEIDIFENAGNGGMANGGTVTGTGVVRDKDGNIKAEFTFQGDMPIEEQNDGNNPSHRKHP